MEEYMVPPDIPGLDDCAGGRQYNIERVTTRRALRQVKKINEACLPENYSFSVWREWALEGNTWVAIAPNGEYVGYICVVYDGYIASLAVHDSYRKRGIASMLLRHVADNTKYLHVRYSNIDAIRLYENHGFRITELKRGFYQDGEDGYVMSRM